jgi:glycosyltransferase involved in cell wall biosynthesis
MKRVLVFAPSDQYESEPAFRIRILALRDALRQRGCEWDIRVRPKSPWGRMRLARSASEFHAVILHRKMLDPYEARILRKSLPVPRRIIMDIDDATMYHENQLGLVARKRLERRFAATAEILDVVCAGNAYLAEIFHNQGIKNLHIIPSAVDPSHYPVKNHAPTHRPCLIWIGSASTLKYLEASLPALSLAASRVPGLRLVVICDRPPEQSAPSIPIDFVPWLLTGEKSALLQGDIAIAPTPEDRWTLGKCGFKIVQYLAAGLPVIASPVGVNSQLVADAGFLPKSWPDWPPAIEQLAADPALRAQMGARGRARVEQSLSITSAADKWAQVLQ